MSLLNPSRLRRTVSAAAAVGLATVMLSACKPDDLLNTGHQSQPTRSATAAPTTTPAAEPTTTAPTSTVAPTTTSTTTAPPPTSAPASTTATTTAATTTPTSTSSPTAVPPPPVGQACVTPAWTTSQADAMWTSGDYIVHNNLWNAAGYKVSQSIQACSAKSWSVTVTADNSRGDGAVKTYPNVHKDYHDWGTGKEPLLSSFSTLHSTFAATGPDVGIYDIAYDIWLNGVPGKNEVMIWTGNRGQTPSGSVVARNVVLSGISWDVWASDSNSYLAFVPHQTLPAGSLDLGAMLNYLTKQNRLSPTSTLGQIDFGVEVVSTDGKPATFRFTDFSVTDH